MEHLNTSVPLTPKEPCALSVCLDTPTVLNVSSVKVMMPNVFMGSEVYLG